LDWKKVRSNLRKPTGMTDLLAAKDKTVWKNYDREDFVSTHLGDNATSDCERFIKGFEDAQSEIKKKYDANKSSYSDKEKEYLDGLLVDLQQEKLWCRPS
jgi:hypothetical protein